jgi:type IV secretory pathway VirJ component
MAVGRKTRTFAIAIAVVVLGTGAGLGYIGYFGGPVFSYQPATGRTARAERGLAVLFLSSDMGPHVGMGRSLVSRLSASGLPVVTINSLAYFRKRRTPAEARTLIEEGIGRALALPGTRRIVLVGQSFGADMLQAALAGMPRPFRSRILLVILVVPPDSTMFRASPGAIFDFGQRAVPAAPTAVQLTWAPVLCIRGMEEDDSLCPHMTMPNVTRVTLPGGHMLRFDGDRVYAAMLPRIRAAAADAPRDYSSQGST